MTRIQLFILLLSIQVILLILQSAVHLPGEFFSRLSLASPLAIGMWTFIFLFWFFFASWLYTRSRGKMLMFVSIFPFFATFAANILLFLYEIFFEVLSLPKSEYLWRENYFHGTEPVLFGPPVFFGALLLGFLVYFLRETHSSD